MLRYSVLRNKHLRFIKRFVKIALIDADLQIGAGALKENTKLTPWNVERIRFQCVVTQAFKS